MLNSNSGYNSIKCTKRVDSVNRIYLNKSNSDIKMLMYYRSKKVNGIRGINIRNIQ